MCLGFFSRIQQHSSDTGSAASTTRMNIEELKKEEPAVAGDDVMRLCWNQVQDNEQPVADVSQRKGTMCMCAGSSAIRHVQIISNG